MIILQTIIFLVFLASFEALKSESRRPNRNVSGTTLPSESITKPSVPLFVEKSITRSELNSYSGLRWKNYMGDWIDLKGTPQGSVPWASAQVSRKTGGLIAFDVTTLTKAQQGKKNSLMILAATIPVKVSSREGVQSPILKITMLDGRLLTLQPVLDCTIASSTYKNNNTKTLHLGPKNEKALIQFAIPKEEFKTATLELLPLKVYGSGQIQLFNLDYQEQTKLVKKGIANGLSSYSALKGHPDVIFVDTFDNSTIKPQWFWGEKFREEQLKNGYLTGDIDPLRQSHSAVNLKYKFAKHLGEEPTEISIRYSIRFHKDFIFATQGGKLPGQSGTYNTCGWGGRKPGPTCIGWSARMGWNPPVKLGPALDMIPIFTYLYHLDQRGTYGDEEKWEAFCELDKWCELEQYIKLNTPGKKDGKLRGYKNSLLVYERNDIRYRDSDRLKIEDLWALVYHGGRGYPTAPINVDIDNIVISRSHIGLIN